MGDTTSRDALERSLCARLGMCGPDELRVLDAILMGIEKGRDQYGPLDLSKPRDWEREEALEHRDSIFYRACALISRQDEQRRELRAAAGRELVEAGLAELRDVEAGTCTSCGLRLMFGARQAGLGLCSVCERAAGREPGRFECSPNETPEPSDHPDDLTPTVTRAPAVDFAFDMTDEGEG